jgi:hypothetical protein
MEISMLIASKSMEDPLSGISVPIAWKESTTSEKP